MHKDQDFHNTDDVKHSRNTAHGKKGVNRVKRRNAKQNLNKIDESAKPVDPKQRKQFGIKRGNFQKWYKSEKARDEAFDAMLKSQRLFKQTFGPLATGSLSGSLYNKQIKKVER